MAITRTHELHKRRFGRNLGVALTLGAFVLLVFGLTLAKLTETGPTEGFDHTMRPSLSEGTGQ